MASFPTLPTLGSDKKETSEVSFDLDKEVYSISGQEVNWYSTLPYGFQVILRSGVSQVQYLPINPSNISIQTHMATNMVTTLYGVVEEHSPIRFHDVTIQGTTGYMPKYYKSLPVDRPDNSAKPSTAGLLAKAIKFIKDAVSKAVPTDANATTSTGRQAVTGSETAMGAVVSNVSAFFPQTAGIIAQGASLLMGSKDTRSGVDIKKSGYVAFHNLQRMFHLYKKDASMSDSSAPPADPIQFLNHKDCVRYDCTPIQFSVTRSAESPMLYNYSITFRAYNMRGINSETSLEARQANQLDALGLNGFGNSAFKTMKSLAGKGTSLVAGAKSIIGGKGR